MEKIENVDLGNLVTEASNEIIDARRKQAAGIIKQQLQRIEQLVTDISNAEKELKKKRDKLTKAQEKIDKIKAGDWSLLAENNGQTKNNE